MAQRGKGQVRAARSARPQVLSFPVPFEFAIQARSFERLVDDLRSHALHGGEPRDRFWCLHSCELAPHRIGWWSAEPPDRQAFTAGLLHGFRISALTGLHVAPSR